MLKRKQQNPKMKLKECSFFYDYILVETFVFVFLCKYCMHDVKENIHLSWLKNLLLCG